MRTLNQIKQEEGVNSLRAIHIQIKEAEDSLASSAGSPLSDSSVGKSYTMIGFGGPRLAARVKSEGLVLWSISQAKGHPDEFTHGWSGCDPGQLYFVENRVLSQPTVLITPDAINPTD